MSEKQISDAEMDLIEAKAREEAYKPLSEVYEAAKPKGGFPLLPQSVYDGSVAAELSAPAGVKLVHPTGNTVEEMIFDPANVEKAGDDAENPDLEAESVADIVASLPKGSYRKDDGKYYRKRREMVDELAMPSLGTRTRSEYDRVQREFQGKHRRPMDEKVAVILARLASGEIDREEAKNLAYALRYERDVNLAKEMAAQHRDLGKGLTWRDFFVNTAQMGIEVARGRRGELLNAINAAAKDDPTNGLVKLRNMTIAKRFGFSEREMFEPVEVANPEADLAKNYKKGSAGAKAAAKRTAVSVITEVNRKMRSGHVSRNDIARMNNAVGYLARPDVQKVDEKSYEGLDPLIPRTLNKGMRRRSTGYYTDPSFRADKLTRLLMPGMPDDVASYIIENAEEASK